MRYVILVILMAVTVTEALSYLDTHEQAIIEMRQLRVDMGVESDRDIESIEIW